MSNNEDISKLPKWAQARINRLESNVVYWKNIASVVNESDKSSKVYIDTHEDGIINLPEKYSVTFEENEWDKVDVRLINSYELDIIGSGRIFILPQSSNRVRVIFGDVDL